MKVGDQVKTTDGGIETVQEIKGDLVCTQESSRTGTWYSAGDLIPVYYSSELKRFVSTPDKGDPKV